MIRGLSVGDGKEPDASVLTSRHLVRSLALTRWAFSVLNPTG
jgi:hypothetical protein